MIPNANNGSFFPRLRSKSLKSIDTIIVPIILTIAVLDLIVTSIFKLLIPELNPILEIAFDVVLIGTLTLLALKLYLIPFLKKQQSYVLRDIEDLVNTIEHHGIFASVAPDGTILTVNDKFVAISGYSEKELIGQNHRILNSGLFTKQEWKAFYKTIASGNVWQGNIRNINKNGDYYWVYTTVYPRIEKGKVVGYLSMRSDITDIVERSDQLIETNAQLQAAEKRISDFTNHIVHELRTPLHIISNFNSILLEQMHQEKNKQLLKQSHETLVHMQQLVNELLDIAKIKSGTIEIISDDVPLLPILETAHKEFNPLAKEKNLRFILELDNDLPQTIFCDIIRLRQTIYNLIGNAIKFTEQGEVTLSARRIAQQDENKQKYIAITVTDTGPGIPESDLPHIFSEFYQVTNNKTSGTGLGLTISSKLIQLMGGEITVTSETGVGSSFVITLPDVSLSLQNPPVASISNNNDENVDFENLQHWNIVVVDDINTNLIVAEAVLKHYGATVQTFLEPTLAIDYIASSNEKVDVVVTDYNMPTMTGLELAEHLRQLSPQQPLKIYVLSGADADEIATVSMNTNAIDGWLSKPFDMKQLVGLILNNSIT